MGTTREFVAAAIGDAVIPLFRRPMEDVVYETLDRRQVPTRTDLKELRSALEELKESLEGVGPGAPARRLGIIEERLDAMEKRLAVLEGAAAPAAQAEPMSRTLSCKVAGCQEPYRSMGFCAKHYQKWRRGRLEGFPYEG